MSGFDPETVPAPPALPLGPPGPDGLVGRLGRVAPLLALSSEKRELALPLARALAQNVGADPAHGPLAAGMAWWHWQRSPLDPLARDLLAGLDAAGPFLPRGARALLAGLGPSLAPTPEIELWRDIEASGETDMVSEFLAAISRHPTNAPGWLGLTFERLAGLPDLDEARRLLDGFARTTPAPLLARMRSELALARGTPDEALRAADGLDPDLFGLWRLWAVSRALALAGQREAATAPLAALWRRLPWHVNLALCCDALAAPPAAPSPPGPGDAAVLLYSLNKAELLAKTLSHLAGTDLGQARVVVLDNGSTDGTQAVLDRAAGLFPEGAFSVVRLLANVGAPGARNWLLSLPEVRAARFAAFLDDDAFPPTDWLGRLLATASAHPGAGAVGCAIVDAAPPRAHQSGDFNLLPPGSDPGLLAEVPERIHVFDACSGRPDLGFLAYARPCLHVSGCCHLLSMAAVGEIGGFDIRFNPTQFDDLERDMRALLAGRPAVYDGTLRVGHVLGSSLSRARSEAQVAQVMGNKIKLETKYSDQDVARLYRDNQRILWDHWTRRDAALRERFACMEDFR